MYGFPKRITFMSVDGRYFQHSYPNGRKPISPKPDNLFAFRIYTVADSKENRSQFLRFGGGLRSQFLRFRGGLRSQVLDLRSQFLRHPAIFVYIAFSQYTSLPSLFLHQYLGKISLCHFPSSLVSCGTFNFRFRCSDQRTVSALFNLHYVCTIDHNGHESE